MEKTFYKVGYNMVWLLMRFQIFFETGSASFFKKAVFNFYLTPSLTLNRHINYFYYIFNHKQVLRRFRRLAVVRFLRMYESRTL